VIEDMIVKQESPKQDTKKEEEEAIIQTAK
jgi:hypothetical protein